MPLPPFPIAMTSSAIQLGVVLVPVAIYGVISKSKKVITTSACTFAVGMIVAAVLYTPSFGFFASFKYNWLQKAIASLGVLLLAHKFGYKTPDLGFAMPERRSAFAVALLAGCAFGAYDFFTSTGHSIPTNEAKIFELTMPGLQEEPLYRGFLLCIWDQCFDRPWSVLGVSFGPAVLITSAIFTVGHLLALDKNWHIIASNDLRDWLNFACFCFLMCWLRYKFKSVWPAVVAHNADNGLCFLLARYAGAVAPHVTSIAGNSSL
jgi:membrane protease YdiL (CAAX protease family)